MTGDLGAVDRLILDEAGDLPKRIAVIDAPAIANRLASSSRKLWVYCDDLLTEESCQAKTRSALESVVAFSPSLVLMRLPKSLAQLADYTQHLAQIPNVVLLAGGRVKHMTPAMNEVLATGFDRVFASLGRQKSRVLHAESGRTNSGIAGPKTVYHESLDLYSVVYGGTFGGTKLDLGTRLLLSVLPTFPGAKTVDLGCGSGLIAAFMARGGSSVTAVDVSRAACRSTSETAARNGFSNQISVIRNHALFGFYPASVEVIACNPPFHLGTTKDSKPAEAMFRSAADALVDGGQLWTVFNSHLPYRDLLRHLIGPTKVVTQDPKYTVTRSIRRR